MDITIVIPVYNRKALLRHTLESIMRSPMAGVPVIVVDNGSTDGTANMISAFCKSHTNVTLATEPERSAAAARNKGLSMVTTRWVYFFDSDDEFEDIPHKWDNNAQLIAFPTRQKVENKVSVRAYKPVSDPAVQILSSMLNTISMIFRTSWLREIGGWNTGCHVWDDWELGCRALLASPSIQWITSKAYHTVKVHSDSLTGPSFRSRFTQQIEAMEQVFRLTSRTDVKTAARCRQALLMRAYILSGRLLYEGDRKYSALCHTFILQNMGKRPRGRLMGWLLEQYSAMGGRGAWKIALWYVTRKKER